MPALQGPPRPQKTGNAQIDAYLNSLYQWAYLLWYWQTSNGAYAGAGAASSNTAMFMHGLDGEQGEEGPAGPPGATGPQGLPGLTIPGMDGQDGEDWAMPAPVKAPDSYRLEGATWDAPGSIGSTTPAPINATTGAFSGLLSANLGIAVTGSPTGYADEVKFGTTAANSSFGITTFATGTPVQYFDHRGAGNSGRWVWRFGTDGGTIAMALSTTLAGLGTGYVKVDNAGELFWSAT